MVYDGIDVTKRYKLLLLCDILRQAPVAQRMSAGENMDKNILVKLIGEGLSTYQIGNRLNKSQTTARYWLDKYSLSTNNETSGSRKTWSDNELIDACANGETIADVVRSLSLTNGAYATIKKYIKILEIDISHFVKKGTARGQNTSVALEKVMVKHSSYHRGRLKKRLLSEGIFENKCDVCGQNETWHGGKLIMVLDHINGVPNDHRMENLRLLCPNCNSQQDTFCGRNIGHVLSLHPGDVGSSPARGAIMRRCYVDNFPQHTVRLVGGMTRHAAGTARLLDEVLRS